MREKNDTFYWVIGMAEYVYTGEQYVGVGEEIQFNHDSKKVGNMELKIHKNMVVQFNEQHKWSGCFGIVAEDTKDDKYLIGVPIPDNTDNDVVAFIFAKKNEFEVIGESIIGFEESILSEG